MTTYSEQVYHDEHCLQSFIVRFAGPYVKQYHLFHVALRNIGVVLNIDVEREMQHGKTNKPMHIY